MTATALDRATSKLPEATEFFIVGPARLLGSEDDQERLLARMSTLYPGCEFGISGNVFVHDDELSLIPVLGSVGGSSDEMRGMRRRPDPERLLEMTSALNLAVKGKAALS